MAITGLSYSRPGRKTLDRVLHDLRFAFRGIVKEPGFASTVVITMALGIGAGTAIFSFVDGMLLRPLPFSQPDRLVRVWASHQGRDDPYVDLMYGDVRAFASGVPSFASVTGLSLASRVMMDDRAENRENVVVARTTASFFETLGVTPVLGRVYTEAEARRGEQIVLISHELWERRYGATPDAIGSLLHLDVRAFRIVGVLPQGVEYPEDAQVWRALSPDEMQDDDREVHVVARLGPEATASAANAAVQRVATALAVEQPETHRELDAWIQPLQEMVVRDVRTALLALLGAVGLLLVIACVNTANLLLSRSARRRHEVAIRRALGASRGRIVTLHLVESLLLAGLGGLVGILLGRWILELMLSVSPELPRLATVSLDVRVVAVMASMTVLTGILFGVAPALISAGTPPEGTLRDGGHATTGGGGRTRLQSGLVATEIALSTMLAVLALLLFATFRTSLTYDRGFEFDNLVEINVDPMHPPAPGDATRAYFARIVERVERIGGVREVALSSHQVLEHRGYRFPIEIEGAGAVTPPREATIRIVSEGFFRTAGLPVRLGRGFSPDGGADDEQELVVNDRFLTTYLTEGENPLAVRIRFDWGEGRIVGVVGDVSPNLNEPAPPILYRPFARTPVAGMWLTVRTLADPAALVAGIRREVEAVDPNVLLERVTILERSVRASVAPQRFNMVLVIAFAVLALGLAAVGIYGVTAFSVATRRTEIGIRRALGASDPRTTLEIAGRVALLTAVGVVLGLVGAASGGRLVASLLVGVSPTEPSVLAGVAALMVAVSAAATLVPVLRALRIDPTESLRSGT